METNKELANQENKKALANPEGLPEIPQDELIIPRAKLLQALSPEIVEGITGLKSGMVISNITKEVLPAKFAPFFFFRVWIKFNPRQTNDPNFDKEFDPGQFIWRSTDPLDPRVIEGEKFGDSGERPAVTKFLCFLSRFEGYDMPVVVSFANTSLKAGKQLLTQLAFLRGIPIWTKSFTLGSTHQKSDKGAYFVLNVAPSGTTSEAEQEICSQWHKSYSPKAHEIILDDEGEVKEKRPF